MATDDPTPSTPSIVSPVLRDVRDRLRTAAGFETAEIVVTEGQTRLQAIVDSAMNPPAVGSRALDVRWDTNDEFRIHSREDWDDHRWMQRWERHPNEHNDREHFPPPPDAATPDVDRSWSNDYRDVMASVLSALADRTDER